MVDWSMCPFDEGVVAFGPVVLLFEGPKGQYINCVPQECAKKLVLSSNLDIVSVSRMVVMMM